MLVNNWEATYFNFNADKIEQIASAGRDLGIELFVLDDGWFGKRNDDTTSLGDWVVDKNKSPEGLEDLVKRVRNLDMQFGLWFEPEMISRIAICTVSIRTGACMWRDAGERKEDSG